MKCIAVTLALLFLNTHAQGQTRRTPRARQEARAVAAAGSNAEAPGATLPIKRVILYSNGVAYFERRGRVAGHAEINLAFKQSQVDDVLKSLVVLDLGRAASARSATTLPHRPPRASPKSLHHRGRDETAGSRRAGAGS